MKRYERAELFAEALSKLPRKILYDKEYLDVWVSKQKVEFVRQREVILTISGCSTFCAVKNALVWISKNTSNT